MGSFDYQQDADVFPEGTRENCRAVAVALQELGFTLDPAQIAEIEGAKDFIQLKNGPFDLDLIFAPDGIERFEDAWRRHVDVEGFPVCHPDDIIASKAATNRQKGRESLPRLRSFRDWWVQSGLSQGRLAHRVRAFTFTPHEFCDVDRSEHHHEGAARAVPGSAARDVPQVSHRRL